MNARARLVLANQDAHQASLAPEAASRTHLMSAPLATYARAHAHSAYLAAYGLSAASSEQAQRKDSTHA